MHWFQPMVQHPLDFYARGEVWNIPHLPVAAGVVMFAFGSLGALVLLGRHDRLIRELTRKKIGELELPPSAQTVETALAALKARDPAFDPEALIVQAQRLLPRVLAPGPTAELPLAELSDAMVRRLIAQRELQTKAAAAPKIELQRARIVGAFAERTFDAVHVLLEWLDAALPDTPRADVMVFVRRPHVATRALHTDRCPNCAAPYAGGALNLCTHCKAVLNSGEYGWVLTQHIEFEAYRGPWREFRGVETLLARDPGFSPEVLEDRAALVFWRWVLERAGLQANALRRYADAAALAQLVERQTQLRDAGEREWLTDVVLLGADIVRIRPATDEGLDEVHVRLRWTGCAGAVGSNWKKPRVPLASHAVVFTLVRDASMLSDLRRGISTDRCPNCWAALFEVEGDACSYCEQPFAAGPDEFVLRRFESWEAWLGTEREREELDAQIDPYVPSFKFVEERERLLRAMVAVIGADGEIARSERRLLHRSAAMWGIDANRVRGWIEAPHGLPALDLPRGSWVARAFVEALITAAAIDGHVDSKERALLMKVAGQLGVEVPSLPNLRTRAAAAPRVT